MIPQCQRSLETLGHWEWTSYLSSLINHLLLKHFNFIYDIIEDNLAFCWFSWVKVNRKIKFFVLCYIITHCFFPFFVLILRSQLLPSMRGHCEVTPYLAQCWPLSCRVCCSADILLFLSLCVFQLVTSWSDVHSGRVDAERSTSWRVSLHQPLGWTNALLDA